MSNLIFNIIQTEIDESSGSCLWVADENIADLQLQRLTSHPQLMIITNRFDLYTRLKESDVNIHFNDFDFKRVLKDPVDNIFYRISKEKPVVHHVINQAYRWLRPGGKLHLAGMKKEGVKTYIEKANALFGGNSTTTINGSGIRTATLEKREQATPAPLDDKQYQELRAIADGSEIEIYSKPGIFGWNKIDEGSRFLVSYLNTFIQSFGHSPQNILDLGCGYGYLSIMASRNFSGTIVATDNNAAALDACKKNFKAQEIDGKVIAADCGAEIEKQFDIILCNPPFHQGFTTNNNITNKFLSNTLKLLSANGKALFVVNQFIPLEKKATGLFSHIETMATNGSFKLVELARPI